jgi:hypothetical protein
MVEHTGGKGAGADRRQQTHPRASALGEQRKQLTAGSAPACTVVGRRDEHRLSAC